MGLASARAVRTAPRVKSSPLTGSSCLVGVTHPSGTEGWRRAAASSGRRESTRGRPFQTVKGPPEPGVPLASCAGDRFQAVVHLTKSLAVEWAPLGIRVNAVSPGYTLTPMNRRPEVAELVAEFADTTPLGRLAEPDEIAGPVLFLLGPAASYITGVDLLVDGGYCWW